MKSKLRLCLKFCIKNCPRFNLKVYAFFALMSGLALCSTHQAWAKNETTQFSNSMDSVMYEVSETTYTLNRIQEHQLHIQSVDINYICAKSKVKLRYFYKFGMCQVEAATYNSVSKVLNIKYYSHDLKTGDDYFCEKNAKFLKFVLEDKCLSK